MQAFLITAYKNQDQLIQLVQSLNEHALVYVHLDKKSTELSIDKLRSYNFKNTQFINHYNIPWGGYTHLLAIIKLMKLALSDERVSYIHTISGQDIRIKPWSDFEKHFNNSNTIYMTCFSQEEFTTVVNRRYQQHIITSRGTHIPGLVSKLNKLYLKLQKKFHRTWTTIKPFHHVYKGVIWCSLPRDAASYALDFIRKKPSFLRNLSHVSIPEEFFFQTIFMNSDFKNNVETINLRYTDWKKRNGSNPAILDSTDYEKILQSDCFFARKIDPIISNELLSMLKKHQI